MHYKANLLTRNGELCRAVEKSQQFLNAKLIDAEYKITEDDLTTMLNVLGQVKPPTQTMFFEKFWVKSSSIKDNLKVLLQYYRSSQVSQNDFQFIFSDTKYSIFLPCGLKIFDILKTTK